MSHVVTIETCITNLDALGLACEELGLELVRDLVIRLSDWTEDWQSPRFDVEFYIGGVYDWNESKSFTIHPEWVGQDESFCATKEQAKNKAVAYAQAQIAKLL